VRTRFATLLGLVVLSCGAPGPSTAVDIEDGEAPPLPKEKEQPKAARPPMKPEAVPSYRNGMAAFGRGDLAGSEVAFRDAIAKDPRAFQAHFALGAALERLGRNEDARVAYEAALAIVPDFEAPIVALTTLMLRQGQVTAAESFLNRQLSRVPNSAAALAALAEVKSVQKDSASAQRLAQQSLKQDPDYRPAMVVLARDHYRGRRLDLALYTLTAILDGYGAENPPRDRDNAEARLLRALIYREQGRRKAALEELEKVVKLRPDLVEARINLAAYLLEAGNATAAVPLLEGALVFEPSNVLIHLNLGDGYRLQGRPEEAIKQLGWVVQADPNLAEAHYDLGLVYLFSKITGMTELQAIDMAIQEFEKYIKMRPRSPVGSGDDAEELLARAKNKKQVLAAMGGSAPAPASSAAPAAPASPEAPAPGGSDSGAAAPAETAPAWGAPTSTPEGTQ
jgi:tetratricopeptide (TPR) repeat protein